MSDEATIRNAVSSADVAADRQRQIAWANADTGSRGAISALVESKEERHLCRKFTTTRESFDGVALYRGQSLHGWAGHLADAGASQPSDLLPRTGISS